MNLLNKGFINLLIGQEAEGQGYEPVMILYRLLFNGEPPKQEYSLHGHRDQDKV